MRIELSAASITNAIKDLKYFKNNINFATKETVETLVDKGIEKANYYNDMTYKSGMEESVVLGDTLPSGYKGYIALTGPNAVYDEFGTGEEGANAPHPLKNNFGLNPYNSGPTIRINPETGHHYWTIPEGSYIPSEYVEENGYTEGFPAGLQMYKTDIYIKNIKNDIIKKEFSGAIKQINKKK